MFLGETGHLHPAVRLWQTMEELSQNLPTRHSEFPASLSLNISRSIVKYFLPVYKLRIKQPQHILGITSSFASNNYGSWYPEQKFVKMQMLPKKKSQHLHEMTFYTLKKVRSCKVLDCGLMAMMQHVSITNISYSHLVSRQHILRFNIIIIPASF